MLIVSVGVMLCEWNVNAYPRVGLSEREREREREGERERERDIAHYSN